jgi:hypothetical protein
MEPHIARQGAEERNSVSNEHRHASDDETLNEPRAQESLNRDPAVDVEVVGAAGSESRNDLSRRPCHLFNNASHGRGQLYGATTQDHYALVTIWPGFKGKNRLEGLATYHKRIDARHKLVVAVGLAATRAMKPSTLVPTKTETVIVNSSPVAVLMRTRSASLPRVGPRLRNTNVSVRCCYQLHCHPSIRKRPNALAQRRRVEPPAATGWWAACSAIRVFTSFRTSVAGKGLSA